jgi:phage tail protein X
MKVQSLQGDTVDALCWRHYGHTSAVVEQVYAANPGLAELGTELPHGHTVELPEFAQTAVRETVSLWE